MTPLSRMRRSRDSWKSKATERAEQLREYRKTKARDRQRIGELQARIEQLQDDLSQEKKRRV